jgi:hypothetical protein
MEPGALWHYLRMTLDNQEAWEYITQPEARQLQNHWRHIT